MRKILFPIFLMFGLCGCQSSSGSHVQVSPNYPLGDCVEVGQVIGNANSHEGAREQALADLRAKAAFLSANYVRLMAEAAHGTSIRGMGYRCH